MVAGLSVRSEHKGNDEKGRHKEKLTCPTNYVCIMRESVPCCNIERLVGQLSLGLVLRLVMGIKSQVPLWLLITHWQQIVTLHMTCSVRRQSH